MSLKIRTATSLIGENMPQRSERRQTSSSKVASRDRAQNRGTSHVGTAGTQSTTIDSLPNELLSDILLRTIPEVHLDELIHRKKSLIPEGPWSHPNKARLILSHVCRRWAKVVEYCPQAWTTIVADTGCPRKVALVQRCIRLSKEFPLDVYLWPSKWNWIEMGSPTIVDVLRSQVNRIRTFTELGIQNERKVSAHFNGMYTMNVFREANYSAPILRRLAVVGPGTRSIKFQKINWDVPLLEHVLFFPRVFEWSFVYPENIQQMDIALDTMAPLVWLQALRKCENLHTLRLVHPVSPAPYTLYKHGPILMDSNLLTLLPKLKVLQISGRQILLCQFFHRFHAPALEKVIFRGMKQYLDVFRSFQALRYLLKTDMPNLHSLQLDAVDSLTSKWANELDSEWDMITSLEITNCDFVDKFIGRLRSEPNKALICPQLTSLTVKDCKYLTFGVLLKTVASRLESFQKVEIKHRSASISFDRSPGAKVPLAVRRIP